MNKRILVVDDEKTIVDILKYNLEKEGFEVICAYDGEEGFALALSEKPALILLDIMMPKLDGFTVCQKLREQKIQTPVIMLTARAEEIDKVLGFDIGADDYVTKPFGVRELLARVKSHLRRNESPDMPSASDKNLVYGEIIIYPDKYEAAKRGEVLPLTQREFELMKFLATQKGQVFSREALLEKVWGYEYYGDLRTVDVTIRRLRSKIEDNADRPQYILTRRGVGYYFTE